MKRYALWTLAALLAWWAIQDPTSAAHLVHTADAMFRHAGRSLSTIATSIPRS